MTQKVHRRWIIAGAAAAVGLPAALSVAPVGGRGHTAGAREAIGPGRRQR
jgi:hypothetical protein